MNFTKYIRADTESRKDSRKRHILLIIRWPVGGIRTFIRYVYGELSPSRYRLTILAPDFEELRLLLSDLEKFDVEYVALDPDLRPVQFFAAICRTHAAGNCDLVHSQGLTAGLLASIPSLLFRRPHLLTVHDIFNRSQFMGTAGVIKKLGLSILLPLINRIHAVSHDVKSNILEYVPALRMFGRKVIVIPNGVEIARFSGDEKLDLRKELDLSQNCFLIGFFGRFMSQKGFIYLADAIRRLLDIPNLPKRPIVVAFGDGGFIREEKIALRRDGIDHHFRFMPFIPNIAPVLRGLDVVAMPSLWEACGLLAMETMIAGVPLIGTSCCGLREVLKDTPAVSVPVKDSVALADALVNEMMDPSNHVMHAFRDEACKRFDVHEQARSIENLMVEIMRKRVA